MQEHLDRINWNSLGKRLPRSAGVTISLLLILLAAIAGFVIYRFVARSTLSGQNEEWRWALLVITVSLIALFITIVTQKIMALWREHRLRSAGSQLHARLALLFGAFAVAPATMVIIFSLTFFHYGIESWFSDTVHTALAESVSVADAYLKEHQQTIGLDAELIARELREVPPAILNDPDKLSTVLNQMTNARGLMEALIFDVDRNVLSRSLFTLALEFENMYTRDLAIANAGGVAILKNDQGDRVRALVKIRDNPTLYLYVGRFVDQSVLQHLAQAKNMASEYAVKEAERDSLEWMFALIFALLSLLLLLTSLWLGLTFATRLVQPLSTLMLGVERLRRGEEGVHVDMHGAVADVKILIHAFNRMSAQLQEQRDALRGANEQLARRQEFTEAVLRGVSAGVIGLDHRGRIILPNAAASQLLGRPLEKAAGRALATILPEAAEILAAARSTPEDSHRAEVEVVRGEQLRYLLLSVTAEWRREKVVGYVVTFDDITLLKGAQQKAAWSDIARKIAHEIKNPLTPIQLAAERLRRKYAEVLQDGGAFEQCIETIIRQVAVIERLVQEFSSFARMPEPRMHPCVLNTLIEQVVALQRDAFPEITIEETLPVEPVTFTCDAEQMAQMIGNLVQNAGQILRAYPRPQPSIHISLVVGEKGLVLTIADNGPGWPKDVALSELTEPYVTHREGGTGLGLAIVKKIAEDHNGVLYLRNITGGSHGEETLEGAPSGAEVQIVFSK